MAARFLSLSASILLFASGCEIAAPGCDADSECRDNRVCIDRVCTEVSIDTNNGQNTNNVQTNNSRTNNGQSNNSVTNNQTNNGQSNNVQTNNVDPQQCMENNNCAEGEACSNIRAQERVGELVCVPAGDCSVTAEGFTGEGDCIFEWGCADGQFAALECVRDGQEVVCQCFTEDWAGDAVTLSPDVCNQFELLENIVNDSCGTAFRDTVRF